MYVIHNAGAGTWLKSYNGGAVWTADIAEAQQFATADDAKVLCATAGICECWVEAV